MNRLFVYFTFLSSLLLSTSALSQDTFSIVALDPETGEIGSAGASCVDNAANFGGVILISGIIPGRGAVNGQATICIPHVNLNNAITQMQFGASPEQILDFLYNNDACQFGTNENRQYGIVDFDPEGLPRSAAFTGTGALDYAGHRVGDTYAIQGNILLGAQILDSMEARFLNTPGPLAKRLMSAMQGANVPGADSRCLDEGTSSKSAFLRVAQPDDEMNDLYLEINVMQTPDGTEPIDTLQARFDEWCDTVAVGTNRLMQDNPYGKVFPNPNNGVFGLEWKMQNSQPVDLFVFDLNGRMVYTQPISLGHNKIDLTEMTGMGVLFLQVKNESGQIIFTEKVIATRE